MKALIFALSLFVLIGCKKDDNSNNNSNNFANITTDIIKDTWKISLYAEAGEDETSRFSSYTFTFKQDGTVDAANDLLTETGTWAYEDSNNDPSDDGGVGEDEKLILLFPGSTVLDEISEDWYISIANSNEVALYHFSGGNGTVDNLTFFKQ